MNSSSSRSTSSEDTSGDKTAPTDGASASSEGGAGAPPYTPPQVERLGTVAERTGMPASPSGLSMPGDPSK